MSLETPILCELACPLCVCQHHRMGDFPFHPFSKQERFLTYWDKTFFFFTVNTSVSIGIRQDFIQGGNKCCQPTSGSHITYAYVCGYVSVISHISAYSVRLQNVSTLLVSLEMNHRNKADMQLLFFFLIFWVYLAFCDIGQRNNIDLTFFILAFLNTSNSFNTWLYGYPRARRTRDQWCTVIDSHNPFRPISYIGTSMQCQMGSVASDHELLSQNSNALQSTHSVVCVQISKDDWFFISYAPNPFSENANYSKAPNKRASSTWCRSPLFALDEAGLSKPAGRTVLGDACKRSNQDNNFWAARCMRGSQERSWGLTPLLECFSTSGLPCDFQAGLHADPYFPWHPKTPSEDESKPPCGIQADTEDEKGPSCLGCISAAPQTPTDPYTRFARLLSQSRHGVGLARGAGAAPVGLWTHLHSWKDLLWWQCWGPS